MKALLLICLSISSISLFAQDAVYNIRFNSTWSQSTHPHTSGSLPGNAHWSNLVGAVHHEDISFVSMGALASPGVEDVAEFGANSTFFNEVNQGIDNNLALTILDGGAINTSSGELVISDVLLTQEFSRVSLLSMIAPSPDWIIAVDAVDLLDDNGNWLDEVVIDLYPYDAGTDSGTDYTSGNSNTNPAQPISSLQGIMPFSTEVMGTMTFSLAEVLSMDEPNAAFTFNLFPNPAQSQVEITLPEAQETRLTMFSVLGKEVLATNLSAQNHTLDVSKFSPGVYLVQVERSNQSATKKLVIR